MLWTKLGFAKIAAMGNTRSGRSNALKEECSRECDGNNYGAGVMGTRPLHPQGYVLLGLLEVLLLVR